MSKRFYRMLELGDDHDYSGHVEVDNGVVSIGAGSYYGEREYHRYTLTPDEARAVYEALRDYYDQENNT